MCINVREGKGSESMVEVREELSNPKYFLVVMKNSDEKSLLTIFYNVQFRMFIRRELTTKYIIKDS